MPRFSLDVVFLELAVVEVTVLLPSNILTPLSILMFPFV